MPQVLKRTQRRELTLTRSFANAVKSKISSPFTRSPKHERRPSINSVHNWHAHQHDRDIQLSMRARPYPAYTKLHFIHLLPAEILAQVFISGSEDTPLFPLTVSHVCSSWRAVALRTPSLWRRITVLQSEELRRLWIYRAKACSLDVQLIPHLPPIIGHFHQPLDYHLVQWCMHSVARFVPQWRSLDIVFPTYAPYLWNAALSGCCGGSSKVCAPLLEELRLVYPSNDDTKEFCLFNGYSPRLRRTTIEGIRLAWLPSLFQNLTHLDYTHHGFTSGPAAVHEVLCMLQTSCRLVELRLAFPSKAVNTQRLQVQPSQRLSLVFLRKLCFSAHGGSVAPELIHLVNCISTPSLHTLRLSDPSCRPAPFSAIRIFFATFEWPRTLRVMRIEHGWYDYNLASQVLQRLPRLRQEIALSHPRR
ncbi:hypothetical protein HGRIS_005941 [Hohenbuehelia grisea]|uniref:F-box domain-containing protein n=1 Tax=Hohenbuehelia grisea TaxID=104357 RepID=A0ABR3JZG9_9AGAR